MFSPDDVQVRLPGVVCETRLPNLESRPLRLDVAAFVGLAERGPLDVPVLIEDISQYRLIFGGDLPLARVEGRPLFAFLPQSVAAFFENGGRRCYVVRVAGAARRANQFQLPGLLQDLGGGDWQPVIVPAAWAGRWSDRVSLAASLRLQPLQIRVDASKLEIAGSALAAGSFQLPLRLPTPRALQPGDLLRLELERAGKKRYHLYVRAASVVQDPAIGAVELSGIPVVVRPTAMNCLFRAEPEAVTPTTVALMTASGWADLPFAAADYGWSVSTGSGSPCRLTMPPPDPNPEGSLHIDVGALLRIGGPGGEPVYFVAEQVQRGLIPGGSGGIHLIVESAHPLQVVAGAADEPHWLTEVDVLSFDLAVREGETTIENWPGLRFGDGAVGWRAMLQPPVDMNSVEPPAFTVDRFTRYSLRLGATGAAGATTASGADGIDEEAPILPIGMGVLPVFQGPRADLLRTGKDGLDNYDPVGLFVDEAFITVGTRRLPAAANDLLHLATPPRRLRALHSLFPVDEAAVVAIPDLAHVGWTKHAQPQFGKPPGNPPPPFATPPLFRPCPPSGGEHEDPCLAMPVVKLKSGVESAPSSQAWLEDLPEQLATAEHDGEAMRDVQRALIRLCAARADMVALLSLPQHYDGQTAAQWHEQMTATPDFYDGDPLSYAALYHSWPAIREETVPMLAPLRHLPPDGFVAGLIAARELRRGAWIAPANVTLQNVVDLAPPFGDDAWAQLYYRRLNIVRHLPGRYVLMSAMTLAHDRTLRQLSVRRLLILLRKLALREGQRYMYETNNERLRALVQTYFENILSRILERGGLQAFQVVTNEEINTRNDYDNGRFLIALKVAPTLPIEYITITMLRSGDDAIAVLGG